MDTIATPRRTRMFALAWLVAASALLGAFTMHTFNLDAHRGSSSFAREFAAQKHHAPRDRINAMAVGWQDSLAWMQTFDAIAKEEGEQAQHARNYLDWMRAKLAKVGR